MYVVETCKQPGKEAIERLHFLAPCTGEREGGEKMQPFNRFPSHPVMIFLLLNPKEIIEIIDA